MVKYERDFRMNIAVGSFSFSPLIHYQLTNDRQLNELMIASDWPFVETWKRKFWGDEKKERKKGRRREVSKRRVVGKTRCDRLTDRSVRDARNTPRSPDPLSTGTRHLLYVVIVAVQSSTLCSSLPVSLRECPTRWSSRRTLAATTRARPGYLDVVYAHPPELFPIFLFMNSCNNCWTVKLASMEDGGWGLFERTQV